MIPKPCLENLEITLPDLATQRLIVEIDRLSRRESELMIALAEKKRTFTSFALLKQMKIWGGRAPAPIWIARGAPK